MIRSGKQKSIDKANKAFQARNRIGGPINESKGAGVNTPIVILKDELKGQKAVIKEIRYYAELRNGDIISLVQGDFYNDSDPDLPF
jgi:hypothetical protein